MAERTRELEASTTKLRETEQRFRLLVEAVTDYAIFMLDRDCTVQSWNEGAQRIKGYTHDEIVGRHFSCFYTEEDRLSGVPERALATAARTGTYEAEGWGTRKDGKRFWASVSLSAIRDPERRLVGFAKITRDLTERRQNEERLRQAQKMEALGQLTGGVAHDFNNVLTVISGNLEALLRQLPDFGADRLRHLAANALKGTERATLLVRQLLAFSRRQPLAPNPIAVHTLISGLSDLLRRAIGEGIAIETVTGGGLWPIFADANQLESALINLAVNARDAMPEGGRLTIKAENAELDPAEADAADVAPGFYVALTVSDTGTGMAPEIAAQAFDPFFTTKPPGQGTGLGLSQVYGFIKQSGGHVRIASAPGAGTHVTLFLPRHVESDETAAELPASHASLPRAHGETVLVVEDDPEVRDTTGAMLRELGYEVIEAPDGNTGLRLLEDGRAVNLLLTDVVLPGGMNGR
ncbi:MAG: PAS domain S-box protein, partial [Stellaceae bacterium]